MNAIKAKIGNVELRIELRNTPTAKKLLGALPITSKANRWGDEVYFSVPVSSELEDDATDVLEIGDVGYWVEGKSLAIFFGPTPASKKNEPRAIEPINKVGKVKGDVMVLKKVKEGDKIILSV